MLQNRNILCMSTPSWDGPYPKAIVEMMRILAQENKILYVENPATWLDILKLILKGKWNTLVFLLGSGPRKREEDNGIVYVANPGPVLPINFLPHNSLYVMLLEWNNRQVRNRVRRLLSQLDMESELIHINALNPTLARHTMGYFNEASKIYYCYDEIAAVRYMKNHGTSLEPRLMREVDLTLVASEGLYEQKKNHAKRIALVKNGVDFSLFSQGFREAIPEEVLIGYVGSIDARLDLDYLRFCMEAHPDWSFEFVGSITHEPAGEFLNSMPNVRLRGQHSSHDLPAFLHRYSVGIIPFVKNELTKSIYPMKINEYLAAGLPVVLSDFSMLDEFDEIASIAVNKQEFLAALEREVNEDTPEKRKERREYARSNSWKSRAEVFSSEIVKAK